MGTLSLTDPVANRLADATLIATNNAAIKTVVNGGIDDGNIASDAGIEASKLADYPDDATKFLSGAGTWTTPTGSGAGSELDYAQITSNVTGINGTSESAATVIVTGNSVSYDGSRVKFEFAIPALGWNSTTGRPTFVFTKDSGSGAVAIGQWAGPLGQSTASNDAGVYGFMFDTPSAGSHTYGLKAFVDSETLTVRAGAGGAGTLVPALIRVTKA